MQGATSSPTGEGRSLLIIGAGGLGLHGISWAKLLTECQVVVAEPDPVKHPAAFEAGADHVIDTSGPDALELLRDATGGGPHCVIDFVGAAPPSLPPRAARPALSRACLGQDPRRFSYQPKNLDPSPNWPSLRRHARHRGAGSRRDAKGWYTGASRTLWG
jgi:threonine dehydrogenase-like Zn-dependent dehydrogenase